MPDLNDDDSRLLKEVMDRSAVDAEFRAILLKNPHAAVKSATGVALPADLKLRFIETPKDVDSLIVLPAVIETNDELTPQELEAVAGGVESLAAICWDTCGTTCRTSCTDTCVVTGVVVA